MTNARTTAVSAALRRVRTGVMLCGWVAGLALAVQTLIWSLATFTDIRFQTQDGGVAPLIVKGEASKRLVTPKSMAEEPVDEGSLMETSIAPEMEEDDVAAATESAKEEIEAAAAAVQRPLSKTDGTLNVLSSLSVAAGKMALIVMFPLIFIGTMVLAGAAAPGVEKAVAALMWSIVVGLIVLPVGASLGMPWSTGVLTTYAALTAAVDQASVEGANMVFYARYLLLPIASIAAIAILGLMFSSGLELAILAGREVLLDPAIESEASNIKATSLHAGRSSAALSKAVGSEPVDLPPGASATQVSVGKSPGRLI